MPGFEQSPCPSQRTDIQLRSPPPPADSATEPNTLSVANALRHRPRRIQDQATLEDDQQTQRSEQASLPKQPDYLSSGQRKFL